MRYRLRALVDKLIGAYWLITRWGTVCTLWLFVPLFMLANWAIALQAVPSNPVWAAGTLVAGQGIGVVLLWAAIQFAMATTPACVVHQGSGGSNSSR